MEKLEPSKRLLHAVNARPIEKQVCPISADLQQTTWINEFDSFEYSHAHAQPDFNFPHYNPPINSHHKRSFIAQRDQQRIIPPIVANRIDHCPYIHPEFPKELIHEKHKVNWEEDLDKEYNWDSQFNQELDRISGTPGYSFEKWAADYRANIAHLIEEHEELDCNWKKFGANGIGYEKFAIRFYDNYVFSEKQVHNDNELQGQVLYYESLVQETPYDALAYSKLGMLNSMLENDEQSIAAYYSAVKHGNHSVALDLAAALLNQGCRADCLDAILYFIQKHSEYSLIKLSSSKLFNLKNNGAFKVCADEKYWICLCVLLQSLEHFSSNADIQKALGILFTLSEDNQKALDCFKLCLEQDPSNVTLLNMLGATFSNIGDYKNAKKLFEEAIEESPCFIRAKSNLALCYYKEGDLSTALEILKPISSQNLGIQKTCDIISNELGNKA